jgi:hypothetical protein
MARYFKDSYLASGSVMACDDLNRWTLKQRDITLGNPKGYSDDDIKVLLKNWGIGDPHWNFLTPCDIRQVTQLEFTNQKFHSTKDISGWFSNSGI